MYGAATVEAPDPPTRDSGYRAGARLRSTEAGRTRATVFVLVGVVAAGIAFAALGRDHDVAAPAATTTASGDVAEGSTGASPGASEPSALPILEILAQPAPTRPVPINAGWLRWLDPVTGALGGDATGPEVGGSPRTFIDSLGRALEVCVGPAQFAGGGVRFEVRMCRFDARGAALEPRTIGVFTAPLFFEPWDKSPDSGPFQLDATVSADGRTLWVVTSARTEDAWSVSVRRVDVATGAVVASREIRSVPVLLAPSQLPSPEGWLVQPGASLRPVIRVSPDGDRLSVTLTAAQVGGAVAIQQERVILDSSLGPSKPIEVAWPAGASADPACDPARAAWASETDFLSLCQLDRPDGAVEAFARLQDARGVFHDVDVGPMGSPEARSGDDSSWLLDEVKGVLYRWEPSNLSLSSLDVRTGDVSTTVLGPDRHPRATGPEPPADLLAAGGRLAWTQLAAAGSSGAGLQMAGSGDGRYLYLVARQRELVPGGGPATATQTLEWVVDTVTGELAGRGVAPGPIDQVALAPGGGLLVELATPSQPAEAGIPSGTPRSDWTTQSWFVDATTGQALEMVGRVRGPGGLPGFVLSPSVGTLAGF